MPHWLVAMIDRVKAAMCGPQAQPQANEQAAFPSPVKLADTCVALMKLGGEVYLAVWRPEQLDDLIDTLDRWGDDPSLAITPAEAAALAQACVRRTLNLEDQKCTGA